MIVIILVIVIAICNAIMNTISHHYSTSIFTTYYQKFPARFWDPYYSWRNKYIDRDPNKGRVKWFGLINVHPAFTDAWHLFKSIMIICMISAIVLGPTLPSINIFEKEWMNIGSWILILGTLWNITFSLFYNVILRK